MLRVFSWFVGGVFYTFATFYSETVKNLPEMKPARNENLHEYEISF